MLTALPAHQGDLRGVHDLWGAWSADPLVVVALGAASWLFLRGVARRRVSDAGRVAAFLAGVAITAAVLLSPLDALAGELASAHMVQHALLVLVAAPSFAWCAPTAALLAGAPPRLRRAVSPLRRRVHGATRLVPWPAVAWMAHSGALWFWHASGPYDAAVEHDAVHALEHTTFLATAVLFWWAVMRRTRAGHPSYGHGALLVFTMALQSVFLSVLLTFATTPWYRSYGHTERWWGLTPLADQHLAGVIMWVPAGLVYVGAGILLVGAWLRDSGGLAGTDNWGGGEVPAPKVMSRRR